MEAGGVQYKLCYIIKHDILTPVIFLVKILFKKIGTLFWITVDII